MRRAVTVVLLLAALTCGTLAAVAMGNLIDQPWDEVREPILSDRDYLLIFSALTILFSGAALALVAVAVRRLRGSSG